MWGSGALSFSNNLYHYNKNISSGLATSRLLKSDQFISYLSILGKQKAKGKIKMNAVRKIKWVPKDGLLRLHINQDQIKHQGSQFMMSVGIPYCI